MANRFALAAIFNGIDRLSGPVQRMQHNVQMFAARTQDTIGSLSSQFRSFGIAAAAAGAGVSAGMVNVMQTGMSFEKTLLDAGNKFQPGIEKSSELFKKLGAAAKEVGGATEFSSAQAALALNDLAGAGFSAEQAIAALPGVVNFATAASLDLAQASEVAVKALGAYGLKSDDPVKLAANLQLVTDTLMKADALSSTNISAIFEAYKEAGPVANSLGVPIQSFSAMIATLGTAGVEGSVAGTTLKNVLLSLAKPTDEAGAALARFRIKTKDAAGNLRDPIAILDELGVKTAKLGTADKAAAIEGIFGKIPIAGVNVLLDKMTELQAQRDEINRAGGQVELVATSKRSGGTSSWDNFTSALEGLSLKAFDVIGPDVTRGIEMATEGVGELASVAMPFLKEFSRGFQIGFGKAWPTISGAMDVFFAKSGGVERFADVIGNFGSMLGKVTAVGVGFASVFGATVVGVMNVTTKAFNILIGAGDLLVRALGSIGMAIDTTLSNIAAKWREGNFVELGVQVVTGIAGGIARAAGLPLEAIRAVAEEMLGEWNTVFGAPPTPSEKPGSKEVGRLPEKGTSAEGRALPSSEGARPDRMMGSPPWARPTRTWRGDNSGATGASGVGVPPTPGVPPAPTQLPASAPQPAPLTRAELRDEVKQSLEVTVRAAGGSTAEVTKKPPGAKVNLQPSGAD